MLCCFPVYFAVGERNRCDVFLSVSVFLLLLREGEIALSFLCFALSLYGIADPGTREGPPFFLTKMGA